MAKKIDDIMKKVRRDARKKFPDADMDEFFVKGWITKEYNKRTKTQTLNGIKTSDKGDVPAGGRIEKYWSNLPENRTNVLLERFGIRGVEYGNWVNQEDRAEYTEGLIQSLPLLATLLDVPEHTLGQGKLSLAIGARGSSAALAHYEPGEISAINLTKKNGWKGVTAHEYGHFLDNQLCNHYKVGKTYASSFKSGFDISLPLLKEQSVRGAMERLFHTVFWNKDKPSRLQKKLQNLSDYWGYRHEVFARIFEQYAAQKIKGKPDAVSFLTRADEGGVYLTKDELKNAEPFIKEIFDYIRTMLSGEKIEQNREQETIPGLPTETELPKDKPKEEQLQKNNGIILGEKTEIATNSRTIAAQYAVVELDTLLASHNEKNFATNKEYPGGCQQRDYTNDKAEQLKVINNAKNFNPRFVINDDLTAANGAPIIAAYGENKYAVLGGNSRTMSLKLLTKEKADEYRSRLERSLPLFGISQSISGMQSPVLVRLVAIDYKECSTYSNLLNTSLTQSVDNTTNTVSLARQLNESQLQSIAEALERGGETLASALSNAQTVKQIISVFRKANIVTDQNISQFIDPATQSLSSEGKLKTEGILLGSLLPDKTLIDAARNYTDKIIKVIPLLARINTMAQEWNIIQAIQQVIRYESERRKTGTDKKTFIAQIPIEGNPVTRTEGIIWDAMDGTLARWKDFLQKYIQIAEAEIQQQGGNGMFTLEPVSPNDAIEKAAGIVPMGLSGSFYTFSDLTKIKTNPIPLYRMSKFFVKLNSPSRMMVWGNEGQGKSTLINHFLDDLDKYGKTLVVLSEVKVQSGRESERATMITAYLRQTLWNDRMNIDQLRDFLHKNTDFKTVVIDSLTMWGNVSEEEILDMWDEFPNINFIYNVHATKDGKAYRGYPKLSYMVDTVIIVEEGTAMTKKHRDGPAGQKYVMFTNNKYNNRNEFLGI